MRSRLSLGFGVNGWLECLPLVLFLLAAVPRTRAATADTRPNVVLILSDDQHWSDYGFMGHEQLRTPNLDRLARESLVFTHGYVPSSLCCPSLASLITGRYPHEHLIVGNDPPEDPLQPLKTPAGRAVFDRGREQMNHRLERWPRLPKLLGAEGYRSLQTGKWWQGNFSRGGFDEGMTKGTRHGDGGLAIGRQTMQPVYEFIGRCTAEQKPFFVWYAPMLPHDPHDPPQDLVDHYALKTDSIHVARYWGNVERFDRSVGDLLEHLDRENLAENTLVVYVADNGWITNPEQGRFAPKSKLSPYDGGLRTPIMLRQSGRINPGRTAALASSLDLMPTILTACGSPVPQGLPGLNLLDAPAVAARKQLFGECFTHSLVDLDEPARSLLWRWTVRQEPDGRLWKLIVPATESPQPGIQPPAAAHSYWATKMNDADLERRYERGEAELYDVAADPTETHNLAAAYPEIVEMLRESLDAWWTPTLR
jgi:arylsulfatase A-like enzyme